MKETLKMLMETRQDIYYDLKSLVLYHSNSIEGSTFTKLEIETLVNENIVTGRHEIEDVIETKNSIQLFDYIIKSIDEMKLTSFELRQMHSILKKGTIDQEMGFVGKYKPIENSIRGSKVELSKPFEVENLIDELLQKHVDTIEEIAIFHKEFELIHPFTDGNGRIGRMIVLKQCLENNIVPPLITKEYSNEYKKALEISQLTNNNEHIINVFIKCQKEMEKTKLFKLLKDIEASYYLHQKSVFKNK